MQLLEKTIPEGDSEVHITLHHANDVVVLRTANATITSRLVAGLFPRYQSVIPTGFPRTVEFNAGSCYTAIRQAMVVAKAESIGVNFAFSSGMLELHSETADVGRSSIQLAVSYGASPVTISLNPSDIADLLKVLLLMLSSFVCIIDRDFRLIWRRQPTHAVLFNNTQLSRHNNTSIRATLNPGFSFQFPLIKWHQRVVTE